MDTGLALAFLLTGLALSLPSMLGVSKIIGWKKVLNHVVLMWILSERETIGLNHRGIG